MLTIDRKNCTLVIQGNKTIWTTQFLEEYKKSFDHIILSTWEDEVIEDDTIKIIKSKKPSPGPGNCNLQIVSTLEGIKQVKTEYCIKVRSDILIKEPEKWLQFFSENWSTNRLFVLGLSNKYIFSARDQLFGGKTEDMLSLFSIPHLPGEYTPSPSINSMYPELWITLHYYSKFSEHAHLFLHNSGIYIYEGSMYRGVGQDVWSKIGTTYMYPVPRSLKYYWPKRFGENDYNYDETAITYGEFWHDDISNADGLN